MDKLLPSPNGSLEEIQAWHNMMDSVVAFFKACSHLMNTITNKMNAESGGVCPKRESNLSEVTRGSEPECRPCRPRSPCGVCGRKRALSTDISGTAEKSALQGGGGDKCICAEIKAKRSEEKKDRRRSSRNGPQEREEEEHPPEKHSVEVIRGWDATPGNRVSMVMRKVGTAQQEISRLQEEQAKLQSVDATKRITPHGGPNPEALYREIMKDNTGIVASQRPLGPSRERPYPTRIPEILLPGDPSTGRSGVRTPVMPLARSRARRYCPTYVYSPYKPPSMDAPSASAVEIDGMDFSNQSPMETSSTPNFFPPRVCSCGVRAQRFSSPQSFTSSSQPSIEGSSQEYKEISPNPAYWSRLAVFGDSDAEDQMGSALH